MPAHIERNNHHLVAHVSFYDPLSSIVAALSGGGLGRGSRPRRPSRRRSGAPDRWRSGRSCRVSSGIQHGGGTQMQKVRLGIAVLGKVLNSGLESLAIKIQYCTKFPL